MFDDDVQKFVALTVASSVEHFLPTLLTGNCGDSCTVSLRTSLIYRNASWQSSTVPTTTILLLSKVSGRRSLTSVSISSLHCQTSVVLLQSVFSSYAHCILHAVSISCLLWSTKSCVFSCSAFFSFFFLFI